MPIVPMPQQQVGTAPAPDVRVSPNAPSAAFPGAVNTAVDFSGARDVAEQLHQQELQRANTIRVTAGLSDLLSAKNDAEAKLWAARGTQVMGLSDQIQSEFRQRATAIAGQMTPAQQVMFQQHAVAEGLDLQASVQRHVSNEMQRVADESFKSLDAGFAGDAIKHAAQGDYDAVDVDIDKRVGNLRQYAQTAGLPQPMVDERTKEIVSNTRFNVMASFAKAGQLPAAIAYYDKYKDDFTGQDAEKAAPMVKAARKQTDGESAAQRILSVPDITATQALDEAYKIDDPAAQKVASEAIMLHFNQRNTAQRFEREQSRANVIKDMDANGGKLNRASPDWQKIEGYPEGEQVLAYQRQRLHPPHEPGDPDKVTQAMALGAVNDDTRAQLRTMNIANVLADPSTNDQQKNTIIKLIEGEQHRYLADVTSQSAKADQEVKRLAAVVKKARDNDDQDTVDENTPLLYAAQQRAKVLQGESTRARRVYGRATAATAGTAAGGAPSAPSAGTVAPVQPGGPAGLDLSTEAPSAPKQPTPDMLHDVLQYGQGYREYLTKLGYAIPAVIPRPPMHQGKQP